MRIDYEHSRTKLVSGFTTRKDLSRVNKNAVPQVLGLHAPLRRASDCRGGKKPEYREKSSASFPRHASSGSPDVSRAAQHAQIEMAAREDGV